MSIPDSVPAIPDSIPAIPDLTKIPPTKDGLISNIY